MVVALVDAIGIGRQWRVVQPDRVTLITFAEDRNLALVPDERRASSQSLVRGREPI